MAVRDGGRGSDDDNGLVMQRGKLGLCLFLVQTVASTLPNIERNSFLLDVVVVVIDSDPAFLVSGEAISIACSAIVWGGGVSWLMWAFIIITVILF